MMFIVVSFLLVSDRWQFSVKALISMNSSNADLCHSILNVLSFHLLILRLAWNPQ